MVRSFIPLLLFVLLLPLSASSEEALPAEPENPSSDTEIVFYGEQRFRDNEDGTVTDLTTGLMWFKDANFAGMRMPYQVAKKWISKLNNRELDHFGYTDWRIPTIQEFQSLVDKAQSSPALSVGHPFDHVENAYYWSASGGFNIVEYIWVVDLTYGLVKFDYPSYCNFQYLWPVRDAQ